MTLEPSKAPSHLNIEEKKEMLKAIKRCSGPMKENSYQEDIISRSTLYSKLFGCEHDSLSGPIFYLAMGIISLLVTYGILMLGGGPDPGIIGERTDSPLKIPFISMIAFISATSAIVGFIGGMSGITWFFLAKCYQYLRTTGSD